MISGIITVAAFIAFAVVVLWAAWPANQQRFNEAAQLPLTNDSQPQHHSSSPQGGRPKGGQLKGDQL